MHRPGLVAKAKLEADPRFRLYVDITVKTKLAKRAANKAAILKRFVKAATVLRPLFEKWTGLPLVASGRVLGGTGPARFINVWGIPNANAIPQMMKTLAHLPGRPTQYGEVDQLVAVEVQDAMLVFPKQKSRVIKRTRPKLYYVVLTFFIETSDYASFEADEPAFGGPTPSEKAVFTPIMSTMSMTGVLNRIVQIWALELENESTHAALQARVKAAFGGLRWFVEFPRRQIEILEPTPWDVSQKNAPLSSEQPVASTS